MKFAYTGDEFKPSSSDSSDEESASSGEDEDEILEPEESEPDSPIKVGRIVTKKYRVNTVDFVTIVLVLKILKIKTLNNCLIYPQNNPLFCRKARRSRKFLHRIVLTRNHPQELLKIGVLISHLSVQQPSPNCYILQLQTVYA